MVERLFLAVPWGCLRFVIVVFPDHTHLLFLVSLIDPDKEILLGLNYNYMLKRVVWVPKRTVSLRRFF